MKVDCFSSRSSSSSFSVANTAKGLEEDIVLCAECFFLVVVCTKTCKMIHMFHMFQSCEQQQLSTFERRAHSLTFTRHPQLFVIN